MSPLWIVLTLLPILGGAERFNCRGRILGAYYADAKSGCKAFHVCVRVAGGGIRDFRFFCPPGTLFHQEAQTCTDWGDDDPLACPADIYDGQFDLYKIGSGFDTKKLSQGNRDDEAEFGLQRAETGDRRLSQNNADSNAGTSDLRAAHSSDFFSGQRDRGRDDSVVSAPQIQQLASVPATQPRQSFRRPTSSRPTQHTTYPPSSSPTPLPSKAIRYDQAPKRKLARKRPIFTTTQSAPTYPPNTLAPQAYSEQPKNFNRRIPSQNTQNVSPTPNVPAQYKDEYVEVSRVTPKTNRFFPNSPAPTPFAQTSTEESKKNGLVELYNYDAQSTPGFNGQSENRPFKLRNSFSIVPDVPKENDILRSQTFNYNGERGTPNSIDFTTTTRSYITTTPAYRNANSISYEKEKNNYNQFISSKQNYFNSPTTTSSPLTTTYVTTTRYESSQSLNTIAYNTNNAFNAQTSNFADSNEDDGQYRPPEGEDDGQYRPELYEKGELLSGAHSLNIAASGNRLFEDQKEQSKNQFSRKPIGKTSPPRPFRPAPTPAESTHTSRTAEITYPTTIPPFSENTQRTFDYYQTYTTTSRPFEASGLGNNNVPYEIPASITSTAPPRTYEPQRKQNRETAPTAIPSTLVPKSNPRPQHHAKPNKDDTSYDYAYYDSDPGFSEYDHIEEFGRTKIKA